ncbi:hypothetical protein Trydic_g8371 [Trypoxylus dichotomus]
MCSEKKTQCESGNVMVQITTGKYTDPYSIETGVLTVYRYLDQTLRLLGLRYVATVEKPLTFIDDNSRPHRAIIVNDCYRDTINSAYGNPIELA